MLSRWNRVVALIGVVWQAVQLSDIKRQRFYRISHKQQWRWQSSQTPSAAATATAALPQRQYRIIYEPPQRKFVDKFLQFRNRFSPGGGEKGLFEKNIRHIRRDLEDELKVLQLFHFNPLKKEISAWFAEYFQRESYFGELPEDLQPFCECYEPHIGMYIYVSKGGEAGWWLGYCLSAQLLIAINRCIMNIIWS